MRFAAMLAGRCCNRHQIFNHQRPQGDLYKLSLEQFLSSIFKLGSVAGRDVFQIPAQQQAVDVACHHHSDSQHNSTNSKISWPPGLLL